MSNKVFRGIKKSRCYLGRAPIRESLLTGKLIKNWIVRDLGEGKNQPAHRILRGHFSRKTYLLFRFSIILRYFLTSEKSKHGPRVLFA